MSLSSPSCQMESQGTLPIRHWGSPVT